MKSEKIRRRNFLGRILALWSTLTAMPVLYAIARYVVPERVPLPPGETATVKISDVVTQGWRIVRMGGEPVIIFQIARNQFKALSAVCTHLGCTVKMKADNGNYLSCGCHGSMFATTGEVIKGPAGRPLLPYKVVVKDENLIVTSA